MISFIKGQIVQKGINFLIIENNGIGYHVSTSQNTLIDLESDDNAAVFTYLHVREDNLSLFGFSNKEELEMFKKLISVNGVGPKAGLSILSIHDTNSLKRAIFENDTQTISKASGIGKKTASKIVLELKDKIGDIDNQVISENKKVVRNELDDVIKVLISLGFSLNEANKSLEKIDIKGKNENQIIKEALKNLNRQVN